MASSTPLDQTLQQIFERNDQWAREIETAIPDFFPNSANEQQRPKVLWIGCSDSRVPESVVTASKPGEIFVHRNIANQFRSEDLDAQAALQFAIGTLGVTHIVVAGHTRCGGTLTAYLKGLNGRSPETPLDRWLAPLVELAREKATSLEVEEFTELNVRVQVDHLVESETIKAAWASGTNVQVHGWIYDLETGRLRDLGITHTKDR
ncbi:hypothetical protein IEO21_04346 [Rhodonia placenta]|uniref:Carbonic anhydrase n=2 Tax=Rhodonia placenta TaxID=104341 RepID=A0A1X6MQX4_9APHY|nr:hypothetical protein POSPLADRAFT_1152015 [Postia placenta MAD-698-R-SB12]KAF9815834.1 hypothetical protein IEO21_04346 [Postia placenta]OSX58787.1 hypothetical protein POSPLADRAFT_1152015 [Postia placenta MAD-698-R-SB12]